MTVEKGYETALGAALGDDLDASADDSAPAHWSVTPGEGDPALPNGVRALAALVDAPPALRRRLAQIGVVLRTEGESLRKLLKPGQRLVSKEGDLWRWDGFTQAAEAPTAAARRLAEKNRLADLRVEAAAARAAADALTARAERRARGRASGRPGRRGGARRASSRPRPPGGSARAPFDGGASSGADRPAPVGAAGSQGADARQSRRGRAEARKRDAGARPA